MKSVASLLLLLAAFACTSCTTLSNRRDMYRPKTRGDGYWTKSLERYHRNEGLLGISNSRDRFPTPPEGVPAPDAAAPDSPAAVQAVPAQ